MLTGNATTTQAVTTLDDNQSPQALMRSPSPSSNPITPTKFRDRLPLPHRLVKSSSTTDVGAAAAAAAAGSGTQHSMAAAVAAPRAFNGAAAHARGLMGDPDHVMDTRTPSPVQRYASADSDGLDYKPDLSQEVAMLSTKLVNAINYQTTLDDSLQQARHELENEKAKNARLAAEKTSLDDMISQGLLIKRSDSDALVAKLRAELQQERLARQEAEKSKKQTEGELESLTSALFEEANTMVSAARRETEAAEKRNSQLRSQLSDTEMLLESQQEQLRDLKGTMERLSERGESEIMGARDSSAPSTPTDRMHSGFDHFSPDSTGVTDFTPEHPLHFSQLLQPIMRNDIQAYLDFQELLSTARRAAPHSRTGSGTHQALASSAGSTSHGNLPGAFAGSSPSLPGAFSFSNSSPTYNTTANLPPLKDSKFYKRTLSEDVEPCLRLDLAPGLSFLSRRSVLSSLLGGSLIVEPFSPQQKFYGPVFACALCGENKRQEPYVRKHRFRTSESDDAQRYPLCDYCLGRVRSVGDFLGFLRMLRDGHWRCEKEEDEKNAWEESVRLRERMFWARLGGGVIPAVSQQTAITGGSLERQSSVKDVKSARQSLESVPEEHGIRKLEQDSHPDIASAGMPAVEQGFLPQSTPEDLPRSDALGVSTGPTDISMEGTALSSKRYSELANEQLKAEAAAEHSLHADDGPGEEFLTPTMEKAEPNMLGSSTSTTTADNPPSPTDSDVPTGDRLTRTTTIESLGAPLEKVISTTSTQASNDRKQSLFPSQNDSSSAAAPDRRPSAVQARVRAMEALANGGNTS